MNTLHDELMLIVKPSIALEDKFYHELDTYLNSGVLDYITKFKITDRLLATQYGLLLKVCKEITDFIPQYNEYLSSGDKNKVSTLGSLMTTVDGILSLNHILDIAITKSSKEVSCGNLNANISKEIRYRNLKANRSLAKDTYDKLSLLSKLIEGVITSHDHKHENIFFFITEFDALSKITEYLNNSFMYTYSHMIDWIKLNHT